MIIVVVTGSRDAADKKTIHAVLDGVLKEHGRIILHHGGARGADQIAAEWGKTTDGVVVVKHEADWKILGRTMGMIRNHSMVRLALKEAFEIGASIVCLAFPVKGAENLGTFGCMGLARQAKIEVKVTQLGGSNEREA